MRTQAQEDLAASLMAEFPDLRHEIEECKGQLLYEMDAFAFFTQAAKMRGDWAVYERCVQLADQLLQTSDAAIGAALRSSYLEHIDFEGSRGPDAWQRISPGLQAAWEQVAAANRRLMALPQTGRKESRGPSSHQGYRGKPGGGQGGSGGPGKRKSSSRKKPRGRRGR